MGGIHDVAGEADAARAAFEEALTIDRRLVETTGETPQTLRDLAVSLGRMDSIRQAAGETDATRPAAPSET